MVPRGNSLRIVGYLFCHQTTVFFGEQTGFYILLCYGGIGGTTLVAFFRIYQSVYRIGYTGLFVIGYAVHGARRTVVL